MGLWSAIGQANQEDPDLPCARTGVGKGQGRDPVFTEHLLCARPLFPVVLHTALEGRHQPTFAVEAWKKVKDLIKGQSDSKCSQDSIRSWPPKGCNVLTTPLIMHKDLSTLQHT